MPTPHVCLNMIVRNESARIIRALDSCKGYISSFAILDTGSSDNTVDLISEWGRLNGLAGIVGQGTFINFSQARNEAIALAKSWRNHPDAPWFDFLLLMDADMELRVTHESAFENLTGDVYDAVQKTHWGSYHNIRLISLTAPGAYIGVTHEYYNAPALGGTLGNLHFWDHADGANRPDKYERDIRLLRGDLENDPENPRSWFYLANSYRDAGKLTEAIDAYRKRVTLNSWDEEKFYAQFELAKTLLKQGCEDAFIKEMLAAYQLRPQRMETLHTLAKYLREKPDQQHPALLFVEAGIDQRRPDDKLFMEDWVYDWGLREEYSILGSYGTKDQKERGYRITNSLALDPSVPEHVRNTARSNMGWYVPKLGALCSSFQPQEINFRPRRGFTAMNPSVCQRPNGGLEVLLRTVNYKIDKDGRYMIGETECNDGQIETENWLLHVGDDLVTRDWAKVVWDRPAPAWDKVIGLEDMRLFWYRGQRQFSATVREQNAGGWCEQWMGDLCRRFGNSECAVVENARRISAPNTTEKNWMPAPGGTQQRFMYNLDTVKTIDTDEYIPHPWGRATENIRGSSQLIPFKSGLLAIVHEAFYRGGKRCYQHRFVHYDHDLFVRRLSLPFVFEDVQIEFCAGMALHPDMKSLVISYGVRDEMAMLAKVSMEEVAILVGGPQ